MLNAEALLVLIVVVLSNHSVQSEPVGISSRIMPWLGILRVKLGRNKTDAATGLILIRKGLALAVASDVAKVQNRTLSKITAAVFFKDNGPWICGVKSYILHPEYYDGVKNTLAIVYLSDDKEDEYWNPINWQQVNSVNDNVYSFRLTDNYQRIQQDTRRMEAVATRDCIEFYKKEKLDYKSLQPTYSACYRVLHSENQCVIDAGAALASKSQNSWLLIGIGTFGPGCTLPSRFIRILPYTSWIKSYLRLKPEKDFRRSNGYDGMEEPYEDQDTFLMSKISDDSIVMRPSLSYLKEEVYGRCDGKDGVLMYREFGTIRTPDHAATGVYSISLYDLFFPWMTCVLVTVMCDRRSQTKFWFDTGFHQEDIGDYIKIVPSPKRNNTKAPKILYIKDTYKRYRRIQTTNLVFKFDFTNEAKLDIEFYGRNVSSPIRPSGVLQPSPLFPEIFRSRIQEDKQGYEISWGRMQQEDKPDYDKNDTFYFF